MTILYCRLNVRIMSEIVNSWLPFVIFLPDAGGGDERPGRKATILSRNYHRAAPVSIIF
jgi:hypothetical protein